MKKIFIISTTPVTFATFFKGQAKFLSKYYQVELVSNNIDKQVVECEGVNMHAIPMSRKITPFKDIRALFKLFLLFKKSKPDIVYSFTPKAGLLSMIAAFFVNIPLRVHNVIGMPLMESKGFKLQLLKKIEQVTYLFSNKLLCNSNGLKLYINNFLTKKNINVVGNGSINGIDTEYFKDNFSLIEKIKIKENLTINENDRVLTYVGRIVKDKGINELIEAFIQIKNRNLKLLIVGSFENDLNPIKQENFNIIKNNKNIILKDFTNDVRPYLAISDIFVLPSYREGLPNILLEAGSFNVPIIATNINGCNEIIESNINGILVNKKDVNSLKQAIVEILENKDLFNQLRANARKMIVDRFEQRYFRKELLKEFNVCSN